MRFRDAFARWLQGEAWFSFWRVFSAVLTLYFATFAYWAGLHDNMTGFDIHSLVAGIYAFSWGKSHSGLTRLRKQPPGT